MLCFKHQGQDSPDDGIAKNDFLFQIKFRKELLVKYAQKLVCINATHSTTVYDFQLITVIVTDDYDEELHTYKLY